MSREQHEGRRATILCVDNNQAVLDAVSSVLRQADYAVLQAPNAEEAFDLLRTHSVDAAILDVRLQNGEPDEDYSGLELAKHVNVPVIALTAYDFSWTKLPSGVPTISKSDLAWKTKLINELRRVIKPVVYISHGHSLRTAEVALRVTQLGLGLCIQEEGVGGGNILSTLEKEAGRAEFGVVLLTAEDQCTSADKPEPRARARQNVVFEWGYLLARLGQDKVLVLREDGVELPSNYEGWVYEKFDTEGNWKSRLAEKLRAVRLIS